ncbi:CCR4-NOT transcription complex subunit 4-like isoform X1 [Ylistrum balloti]|uniref:CCR4-NOT transcription complex subunit 4-like isoform X1 n=1 Tax=Ylistrum balloti TaxID=509963 RepID=UPI002905E07A|nr:CCR4-NOT transcription complex subunit 4-like isoform X1 [Ylistrum balloti]
MAAEEQIECPLCMEPLEIDDINFFPCTCGYQICRFCWHRIRTDENGLCPACRKQYPEDPAVFRPLTDDELDLIECSQYRLQRIKKERKQKDLQRKQKAAENRKHLANVRVVQRNLVFVVGLSKKLAEPEVLKKHEYFGKFGKIHKVVINQSTSYAGAQGPSASAYVTYHRSDDALRAILAVNNVHVDGRTLKASLGTTKYCSHFLRGAQCPKQDCMYLHELGEEAASFTKEEMQVGKHQEYEQKLLESFMNSQNTANNHVTGTSNKTIPTRKKATSPIPVNQTSGTPPQQQVSTAEQIQQQQTPPNNTPPQHTQPIPNTSNKDAWPSLQTGRSEQRLTNGNRSNHNQQKSDTQPLPNHNRAPGNHKARTKTDADIENNGILNAVDKPTDNSVKSDIPTASTPQNTPSVGTGSPVSLPPGLNTSTHSKAPLGTQLSARLMANPGLKPILFDNPAQSLSLFSNGNGFHGKRFQKLPVPTAPAEVPEPVSTPEIAESIQVTSCTDWQAAFGFGPKTRDLPDDDLGFDPWDESSKGLADLLEKENGISQTHRPNYSDQNNRSNHQPQSLPPGFSLSQLQQQQQQQMHHPAFLRPDVGNNGMLGFIQPNMPPPNSYHNMFDDGKEQNHVNAQRDVFNTKDWQDGLRALLPNINISFGATQQANNPMSTHTSLHSQQQQKSSVLSSDSPPHWLKSIHQLTDIEGSHTNSQNHRLPFVQQFPIRNTGWPTQTQTPPPGFQTSIRPPTHPTEPHKISEGLQ